MEATLACLLLGFTAVALACLSLNRSYFTFGPETNYLSTFKNEAERLLAGEPLEIRFHPPFYAMVLAGAFALVGNWFHTGLVVSWVSSLTAMGGSFLLFRKLAGPYAAWGALLALVTSETFLVYSAAATSDVFFLAMYTSTCLLLLLAEEKARQWPWLVAGTMLGLCLLTRTNGITFLLFLATPLFIPLPLRQRVRGACFLIFGTILPLCSWAYLAYRSHSPLVPTHSYVTLAKTYFESGANRVSAEGFSALETKFDSAVQVLTYDPVHVFRTYVRDLGSLLRQIFTDKDPRFFRLSLVAFPVNWLALAGFYSLWRGLRRPFGLILLAVAAGQALLLNFKPYESRYFLFLVPLLGASAGALAGSVLGRGGVSNLRRAFIAVVAAGYVASVIYAAYPKVHFLLHAQDGELAEVLAAAQFKVETDAELYARKPHVSYYLGMKNRLLPEVASVAELEDALKTRSANGIDVYVYYGSVEGRKRLGLRRLRFAQQRPQWLEVVAASETPGEWTLYRYRPNLTELRDGGR